MFCEMSCHKLGTLLEQNAIVGLVEMLDGSILVKHIFFHAGGFGMAGVIQVRL